MIGFFGRHIARHRYFYFSAALGLTAWIVARAASRPVAGPLSGDTFFFSYLLLMLTYALRTTPGQLRKKSEVEDEGIILIIFITVAAIGFSLISLFALLNRDARPGALILGLSIASAPLGWLMLHTVAAFHYAHLYYASRKSNGRGELSGGLSFPETAEPGSWDFLYFSFVIGMTSQVSDVTVTTTPMRQLTLAHGLASFFFNTVLIALAVNVVVVLAQNALPVPP